MNDNSKAVEEIRSRATEYLQPDRSGKGYICPICGDGDGRTGNSGITTKDGVHFTCWRGCFSSADIIDIIGLAERGIDPSDRSRYPDKLQAAADYFNIRLEDVPKPAQNRTTAAQDFTPLQEEPAEDYTAFFEEAAQHIGQTEYWQGRGLSAEVVKRFHVGYIENWRHPKAPTAPPSPRLIVPTSKYSYLARDTRSDLTDTQKKYSKSKVGNVHIFNAAALTRSEKPIFVVEGEIDAMSIYTAGGEAVAIGSTSNVKKLLDKVQTTPPTQPLIVALDNDTAGAKAAQQLTEGLQQLNITYYSLNPAGSFKDVNDRLQNDAAGLADVITAANTRLAEYAQETKAAAYREQNSAAAHLQSFINGIAESVNTPATGTGFAKLDAALDGGLYAGLYTVGAISSLGKTTLLLQICDNIAQQGKDILIISLEMARAELMAKSISRHTLQEVLTNGGNVSDAKTTRGIMDGKRHSRYSSTERQLIQTAITNYSKYAEHIYIIEGMGDIGVKQIRDAVELHKQNTGNAPILVVDYLQIISPADVRATDKQNTDKAVLELKRISRDYKTPVIAISSLNRDNYSTKINMAAFKESGAVEYSADCLIGLQYKGAGKKDFDAESAATKNPREIELVILKQRNGSKGDVIPLEYFPLFNYFAEAAE